MFAQVAACLLSLVYSAVTDVDPTNFETEEELNEERILRSKYCMVFLIVIPLISLICVSFVEEDLKRLRYKLNSTAEKEGDDDFTKAIN